jgi:predicted nucleic acid-binding protein
MTRYFDTAYVAKCYLNEQGAAEVRALAEGATERVSSDLCRVEFASLLQRYVRGGKLSRRQASEVSRQFSDDCGAGVWTLAPLSSAIVELAAARALAAPPATFLRSLDALHLATAAELGLEEVYSNDRRLIAAAAAFGLRAIDVISESAR